MTQLSSVEGGYIGNGEVLSVLKQFEPTAVTSVDLSGNSLSEADLLRILPTYLAPMVHLTVLDLKDNQFGRAGLLLLLSTLQHSCRQLQSLDISENNIMDESLYEVAHYIASSPTLRVLSLITNGLTPRGVPTLCDGLVLSQLVELSLAYNSLGDAGVAQLALTIGDQVPSLSFLDISDNNVGDGGAQAVAKHLIANPKCGVASIGFSCNKIGDAGMIALANALCLRSGNKNFSWLDLGCNPNATDLGKRYFTEAACRMPYLRSLDLSTMDLAPESAVDLVKALETPKHLCALRNVYFFNNPRIAGIHGEEAMTEAMGQVEEREAQRLLKWHKQRAALVVAVGGVALAIAAAVAVKRWNGSPSRH